MYEIPVPAVPVVPTKPAIPCTGCSFVPTVPIGVRLVKWNLKNPPVAIETCAVVVDSLLFARSTLEQLRVALENPKRWVGWTIPQLIDRLAQVGVTVALEIDKSPDLAS
jgi:hypothetical protein